MKQLWNKYQKHKNICLVILGLFIVSMITLPTVFLGQGSYVEIHDQLDGEVLNYMYRAKYLLQGQTIPEFMNGMDKAAMAPPAPFGVAFYVLFSPFVAFELMQWMVTIVGFLGMYFLCKRLEVQEEISFASALIFAYMPFYPVYGLASLGQPLLCLCFLKLYKREKVIWPLLGITFYAGFSSLTLVGYAWVGLAFLLTLYVGLVLKKKVPALRMLLGGCTLTVTYLLTNLDVIGSVLGKGFVTHRSEMVMKPTENLLEKGMELLLQGGAYNKVYSKAIILVMAFLLVEYSVKKDGEEEHNPAEKKIVGKLIGILSAVLVGICLALLWNWEGVLKIREKLGGVFLYFQADRVYWIFPFAWMLLLALSGQLLYIWGKKYKRGMLRIGAYAILSMILLLEGLFVLRDSTLNKNLRLLLLNNYSQVTWESFFMEDTFAKIDDIIGAEKQKKSVISVGMYPSIALYHGYICADGYSNNYDLEYKHAFRRMISGELEKADTIKNYFDDWGNRLYVPNESYGYDMLLTKGKAEGIALALDTEAAKELNVGFVFSAVPILNSEELNLELLSNQSFTDENASYEINVYRLKE